MISVTFEVKKEDLIAFNLHHYRESLRAKGAKTSSWIGVSATMFALAAVIFLEAGEWKNLGYVVLITAVLVSAL